MDLAGLHNKLDAIGDDVAAIREAIHENGLLQQPLLTVLETATMLRVCERRVWELAEAGEIEAVRFSKRVVRFSTEAVLAYIRRSAAGGVA